MAELIVQLYLILDNVGLASCSRFRVKMRMDQKVFKGVWQQTIERLVEDLKWPLYTQPLLFPVSKLSPIVSIPVDLWSSFLTKEGVGEESYNTTARVPVSLLIPPFASFSFHKRF
jgi:hypothetical protein